MLPNGYISAGDHPRSFVEVGNYGYVANLNSNSISAFSLNESIGDLQPLIIPSYSTPETPYALITRISAVRIVLTTSKVRGEDFR